MAPSHTSITYLNADKSKTSGAIRSIRLTWDVHVADAGSFDMIAETFDALKAMPIPLTDFTSPTSNVKKVAMV